MLQVEDIKRSTEDMKKKASIGQVGNTVSFVPELAKVSGVPDGSLDDSVPTAGVLKKRKRLSSAEVRALKARLKAAEKALEEREEELEQLQEELEMLREDVGFCFGCEMDARHYGEAAHALLAPFPHDMPVGQVLAKIGASFDPIGDGQ